MLVFFILEKIIEDNFKKLSKRPPEARLKEGRSCAYYNPYQQLCPWTIAIKLLIKSSQIGTYSFSGQEPVVSPFAWQSNRALYFIWNSLRFNLAMMHRGWVFSISILLRREIFGHRYKEGRQPCENGGRDWSNAATCQRMPRTTRNWKSQGYLEASGGAWPCQYHDFKLLAYRNMRQIWFFFFKPSSFWYWCQKLSLCTSAKLNFRVSGKAEKNKFIALPGKEGYSRFLPLKNYMYQPWRIWWGVLQQ